MLVTTRKITARYHNLIITSMKMSDFTYDVTLCFQPKLNNILVQNILCGGRRMHCDFTAAVNNETFIINTGMYC
jgi:hypothetical protein